MSTKLPAAPAAPDYAAANKEGIQTDIATLPTRRLIESASAAGTKVTYKDVVTGEDKVADFTGLGEADRAKRAAEIMSDQNALAQRKQLELRKELGVANARQTAEELRATDPAAYAARRALTGRINDDLSGKADYAGYVRTNPDLAEAFAREREAGGTLSIEDWGKRHFDTYGEKEGRELTRTGAPGDEVALDTSAAALNDRVRKLGETVPDGSARMADLWDKANAIDVEAYDPSTAAIDTAFKQAQAEFALGSKLDPDSERELMNQARAGQAARGNYLGDAAAVAEATTLGQAGRAIKQERLNNLLGIQERVFGQTGSLRNEARDAAMKKIGALGAVAGQDFGQASTTYGNRMNNLAMEDGVNARQVAENRATRNENYSRAQTKLANASAMVLGMPITNNFAGLGGAANGSVGAPTGVAYNPGTGLNANAGAAGNAAANSNFGTLANMWNTAANIAAGDNANKLSAISGVGGAALGMI